MSMNEFPTSHDTVETLGVISATQKGVHASVYRNAAGDYYFCCHTCGACGQTWRSEDYAVVQAAEHVNYYNHEDAFHDQ